MSRLHGCLATALALSVLVSACGSSSFHRHFEAGRYERAARAYAADSTLAKDDRALFRAAQIHAHPEVSAYDPDRAAEQLRRLLRRSPESEHAPSAGRLLAVVEQVRDLRALVRRRQERIDSLQVRIARLEEEREAAEEELARLRRRLEAVSAEFERTRLELERLKAIDLEDRTLPSARDTTGLRPGGREGSRASDRPPGS